MTTEFYYCGLCEEPVDLLQGEDLYACRRCGKEVCFRCIQQNFYLKDYHICKRCLKGWFQYAQSNRLFRQDDTVGRQWMVEEDERNQRFQEWITNTA